MWARLEWPELAPPHPDEHLLRQGVCVGHPNAHYWTASSELTSESHHARAEARRGCAECPVRDVCRVVTDHIEMQDPRGGLDYRLFAGVRAGEGPKERADRRRREAGLRVRAA